MRERNCETVIHEARDEGLNCILRFSKLYMTRAVTSCHLGIEYVLRSGRVDSRQSSACRSILRLARVLLLRVLRFSFSQWVWHVSSRELTRQKPKGNRMDSTAGSGQSAAAFEWKVLRYQGQAAPCSSQRHHRHLHKVIGKALHLIVTFSKFGKAFHT